MSVVEGVDCLQSILSNEPPKRSITRETLVEAVIADLGDSWSRQPYLIVCLFVPTTMLIISYGGFILTYD